MTESKKFDTKNLKEGLKFGLEFGVFATRLLANGAQFKDAAEFYQKMTTDEEFQKMAMDAWEDRHLIDDEVRDLDMTESFDLGMFIMGYGPRFIKAYQEGSKVGQPAEDAAPEAEAPAPEGE